MSTVLYEVRDRVAIITLNRPDRLNAWTAELDSEYWDRLDEAAGDPDVRAIVVTGAGKGFCAGADMDTLQSIGAGDRTGSPARNEHQTYTLTIPKPVIGAINGACAGLGFVQATMFDIRFAASGAKFTTAFARRGLVAEHGVSWLLPRIVGQGVAAEILMSARVFLAEEAKELGLVNFVVPGDRLMDEVLAYASDLAENVAPSSMNTIKQQLIAGWSWDLDTSNTDTDTKMNHSLKQADFKEGVQSFVEKRPPHFAPVTRS
jgi:enoyl-CoA hydratase/carnithine racemase